MSDMVSEVAYLRGLAEGLNLNADAPEGKMFAGVISVLEKMAGSFTELRKSNGELEDYLETVDQDLSALEDKIYGKDENSDADDEFVDVECPNCGEIVCFDAGVIEDEDTIEIICPNCDEIVYINDDNLQMADGPRTLQGKANGKGTEEDI